MRRVEQELWRGAFIRVPRLCHFLTPCSFNLAILDFPGFGGDPLAQLLAVRLKAMAMGLWKPSPKKLVSLGASRQGVSETPPTFGRGLHALLGRVLIPLIYPRFADKACPPSRETRRRVHRRTDFPALP